jgi:hypothetical protein
LDYIKAAMAGGGYTPEEQAAVTRNIGIAGDQANYSAAARAASAASNAYSMGVGANPWAIDAITGEGAMYAGLARGQATIDAQKDKMARQMELLNKLPTYAQLTAPEDEEVKNMRFSPAQPLYRKKRYRSSIALYDPYPAYTAAMSDFFYDS